MLLRSIVPVLLALLVVAPGALAWAGKGGAEPDTSFDTRGGWMFTGTDTTSCGKTLPIYCSSNLVYFNGFLGDNTYYYPWAFNANPNAGEVGSAIDIGPFQFFNALFGVWKDCNNDGYIGLLDQGLMEYRSEILSNWPGTGASICPATTTPVVPQTGLPPVGWNPSHNDGEWVREYIPFKANGVHGIGTTTASNDPWSIEIAGTATRAWADFGVPGANSPPTQCGFQPWPTGTLRSTGGTIGFADCFNGYQATDAFDNVADANPATQPFSFTDSAQSRDMYHSHSQANIANPWGTPSDASFATVWTCEGQTSVDATPLGPNRHVVDISQPRQPPVDPAHPQALLDDLAPNTAGSPAGTTRSVVGGFDACTTPDGTDSWAGGSSGGLAIALAGTLLFGGTGPHWGNDAASLPYGWEQGPNLPYRSSTSNLGPGADWVFLVSGNKPAPPLSAALGKSTPGDLGARYLNNYGIWQGGDRWLFYQQPLDPFAAKANEVTYVTYYAYVDPTILSTYHLSLPKTTYGQPLVIGKYAQEACGGFTSGIHNGWDCAGADWPEGAKPGQAFTLRDVDCYDESVSPAREQGLGWGLVTGTSCSTP